MGKLTAVAVKHAKPGRHPDGEGLYLLVSPAGAKSWVLRVQVNGQRRDIGVGSLAKLSLSDARTHAEKLRKVAKAGGDPIAERDNEKQDDRTFKVATLACHESLKDGWSKKYAAGWLSTLQEHAFPKLGNLLVGHIQPTTIREAIRPIWTKKPEQARKVLQRINAVLDFAHGEGWRDREAPAKAVTKNLPKRPEGGNLRAMPYDDVPAFVDKVRDLPDTLGRLALLLTIATASRNGEVRQARWSQIDLERRLWVRPPEIMKSRKEHTVTLNAAALAVLKRAAQFQTTENDALIFYGKRGARLSDMTITKAARDAGCPYAVHGFRSSFRDWAAEQMPEIPDPVAEACLAHAVPDRTIAAYKRTQFIALRRQLLEGWSQHLWRESNVIRLAAG